jgi:hypothetical protein
MKLSPFSCYFLSLKPEDFPKTHSVFVFLLVCKNKFHTNTKLTNSVALVGERTMPTERPQLDG